MGPLTGEGVPNVVCLIKEMAMSRDTIFQFLCRFPNKAMSHVMSLIY